MLKLFKDVTLHLMQW